MLTDDNYTLPELVRSIEVLSASIGGLRDDLKEEAQQRRDTLSALTHSLNNKIGANMAKLAVLENRLDMTSKNTDQLAVSISGAAAALASASDRSTSAHALALEAHHAVTTLQTQIAEKKRTWDGYIGGAIGAAATGLIELVIRR